MIKYILIDGEYEDFKKCLQKVEKQNLKSAIKMEEHYSKIIKELSPQDSKKLKRLKKLEELYYYLKHKLNHPLKMRI